MPKFAANLTMMFTELPFPERFAAAAAAGFEGVEFLFPYDYPAEEVAGWLKASGLANVLFNMPPGNWAAGERGMAALPGREEEFQASVETALGYARALGTPTLHVMAGLVPQAAQASAHRATYIENLRHAAGRCGADGRILVIEPINPRDMPGYFLSRQADAHAICAEVGADNLKVQMDFYHTQIVEGDVATKLRQLLPRVGHVQIAGVPDRHEPDAGELNNDYLLGLLDELAYTGWVGCEYRPAGRTVDGLGWFRAWQAKG
jgi:hydroxypyruvate isomerase